MKALSKNMKPLCKRFSITSYLCVVFSVLTPVLTVKLASAFWKQQRLWLLPQMLQFFLWEPRNVPRGDGEEWKTLPPFLPVSTAFLVCIDVSNMREIKCGKLLSAAFHGQALWSSDAWVLFSTQENGQVRYELAAAKRLSTLPAVIRQHLALTRNTIKWEQTLLPPALGQYFTAAAPMCSSTAKPQSKLGLQTGNEALVNCALRVWLQFGLQTVVRGWNPVTDFS